MPITVQDCLAKLAIGTKIPSITLTVTYISSLRHGTARASGKAWTAQTLQAEDQTGTIQVDVWNHAEIPQFEKGQKFIFTACKVNSGTDRTKQTVRTIEASQNSGIVPFDPQNGQEQPQEASEPSGHDQTPPPASRPAPSPARPPEAQPTQPGRPIRSFAAAKVAINRAANLLVLCHRASAYVADELSQAAQGEDARSLFIQMARDGWLDQMPIGRMEKDKSEPPQSPELRREPKPEPESLRQPTSGPSHIDPDEEPPF